MTLNQNFSAKVAPSAALWRLSHYKDGRRNDLMGKRRERRGEERKGGRKGGRKRNSVAVTNAMPSPCPLPPAPLPASRTDKCSVMHGIGMAAISLPSGERFLAGAKRMEGFKWFGCKSLWWSQVHCWA